MHKSRCMSLKPLVRVYVMYTDTQGR
jgi:hypothetical protein